MTEVKSLGVYREVKTENKKQMLYVKMYGMVSGTIYDTEKSYDNKYMEEK